MMMLFVCYFGLQSCCKVLEGLFEDIRVLEAKEEEADLWVRSSRELFLVCRRAEPGDLGGRVCPPPPPPPPGRVRPAEWLNRGVPGTWGGCC